MSTAAKPETKPETKPEGRPETKPESALTARQRAHILEIRARNAMVVAINNESWGNKLTPLQVRAFAEYMRRFNLDIGEIDNLGGRPYRNGRYYMRRIAELAAAGRVEWYKGDHIGPDARLSMLEESGDEWAKDENTRRLKERIRLGVPADATVVYVVLVKMKELALPTEGVKWWTAGRQKLGWSKMEKGKREMVAADPIGDENPVTSVETRAWRRVGRLCAAEIPELRDQEREMEFAADATQEAVVAEAVRADEVNDAAHIEERPIAQPASGDPYALGAGPAQEIHAPAKERVSERTSARHVPDYEVEDDVERADS